MATTHTENMPYPPADVDDATSTLTILIGDVLVIVDRWLTGYESQSYTYAFQTHDRSGGVNWEYEDESAHSDFASCLAAAVGHALSLQGATCEWSAACDNPATGLTPHSIFGSVPNCDRCAAGVAQYTASVTS